MKQELEANTAALEAAKQPIAMTQPPATAVTAQPQISAPPQISAQPQQDDLEITMIGDSVMLGAALELQAKFPSATIDAKESRQVWDAPQLLTDLSQQDQLADKVVIALGANGTLSAPTAQKIMDRLGSERHLYWVIPYGKYIPWLDDCTKALRKLEENYSNVSLLDWPAYASSHSDWFYNDGMHLSEQGKLEYAKFIAAGIEG